MVNSKLREELIALLKEDPGILYEAKRQAAPITTWQKISKYIDEELKFGQSPKQHALKSGINAIIRTHFNIKQVYHIGEDNYENCVSLVNQIIALCNLK